jgi:hypothetical protein
MKIVRNALLAGIIVFGASHVYAQGERLGEVNFPVSCNTEAQKLFQRAAALYHSFDWPRVTKAFQAVLEADPQCGMAWWGIALATQDNPFVWPISAKQVADGWAAIEKAKAIGAKTQRERDYIAALELFYKDGDTVPHRQRALAYENAMEKLAKAYSDDVEAQVLYALALSANFDPTDKKYTKQLKATKVLEPVFKKYPQHPGAAHYLIHSYDYPAIAGKGLVAALKEYEASIAKELNRFRGLYSAGRAAEASGNMAKARAWYDKFAQIAAQADDNVPQVQHAKTFLARR